MHPLCLQVLQCLPKAALQKWLADVVVPQPRSQCMSNQEATPWFSVGYNQRVLVIQALNFSLQENQIVVVEGETGSG